MEGDGTAYELPVDDHREPNVQDDIVIDGQTQKNPNEPVLLFTLKGQRVDPVLVGRLIEEEHPCKGGD